MAAEAADCSICAEALEVPGCSITRCGHVFHTECLETWFKQKQNCPLCKSSCKAGATRVLRAPIPLEPSEEERIRVLSRGSEPPHTVHARVLSEGDELEARIHASYLEREQEGKALSNRKQVTHRLQTELLNLKRELSAARRVEANASAALAADAQFGPEGSGKLPAAPLIVNSDRVVSREAVEQQSRQLVWRWQELRELEGKLEASAAPKRARRD
jgi:hypothetical protein